MRRLLVFFLAVAFLGAPIGTVCLYAKHIHSMEHLQDSWIKSENGLIIAWRVSSGNNMANQIDVFDRDGKPVTRLNVLRLLPDAQRVTISDVSAVPGQIIAVAAVYVSKQQDTRPAASLLYFDFHGQLLSAFALAPSREILQLALDRQLNVWTLTLASDNNDTSQVPMVVEYDAEGRVVREPSRGVRFPYTREIRRRTPPLVASPADISLAFFGSGFPVRQIL